MRYFLIFIYTVLFFNCVNGKGFIVNVYTVFEPYKTQVYQKDFEKKHPDIRINWTYGTEQAIIKKLIAEKYNPKADVVWGLTIPSILLLKKYNIVKTYQLTDNGIMLNSKFIDSENSQYWYGCKALFNVICVNSSLVRKKHIPIPHSYRDLLKKIYYDKIVMPSPIESSSGYTQLYDWIKVMGWKKAWNYTEYLNKNIDYYTLSSFDSCFLVAEGHDFIGISNAFDAIQLKNEGYPITIIVPQKTGFNIQGISLINQNYKAAQTLINWAVSQNANKDYLRSSFLVAYKGIVDNTNQMLSNLLQSRRTNIDFHDMAAQKDTILMVWNYLYGKKSDYK